MDKAFQDILDNLPPKPSRSRLEPYQELIHELRRRRRSYREIVGILEDHCSVRVGVHTLYNFVRVRAAATAKAIKTGKAAKPPKQEPPITGNENVGKDMDSEVRQRIQALKDRSVPARAKSAEKVFDYDENIPLTVTRPKNND